MPLVILSFCMLWLLVAVSKTNADEPAGDHCPLARHIMGNIGGVIDYRYSRVGKEQKVAMEMAVEDFARSSCSKQLVLQLEDSRGDSAGAASSTVELIDSKQVQAFIGTMSAQETGPLSMIHKNINSKPFKRFRSRFRSKYRSEYPEEEEYCNPSIFALRAYDATWAIAQAMKNSPGKISSKDLSKAISSSRFRGVSGVIRFKNNVLRQMPSFQIINVVGNSYREIAFWSPDFGFLKSLEKHNGVNSSSSFEEWGPVYWPGGEGSVPRGWVISETDSPLKIGVPAMGAFHEFVKVSLDEANNKTCVTGFSINVFQATLKRLPYNLPYVFVPFNGSYDKMVEQVHDKGLDAAVGDFSIEPGRFQYAEFSQPYIDSRLVMTVPAKSAKSSITWMLKTFTKKLWLLMVAMHMFIGCLVWILERGGNTEFEGIGGMLWFSVTVFPKGSPLVFDMSEAILKVIESEEMRQMEEILSFPNCSSDALRDNSSLDLEPFAGLFILSGSVSAFGFLVAILRMGRNLQILSYIQEALTKRRIWRWASIHLSRENSTIPKTEDQVQTSTSVELANFAH
ncbi:hypothetical protein H0E87_023934 [Populus deltoides]|uniref:Ionotropic glutamate receptor C-terminal domain-containing protein n=1 Tax=Populus deltoides TaxID=3696 RepID=A0A8T2X4V1_POPDE|nr:hypothetical protein H0E87_023934 [Populus deltoides]